MSKKKSSKQPKRNPVPFVLAAVAVAAVVLVLALGGKDKTDFTSGTGDGGTGGKPAGSVTADVKLLEQDLIYYADIDMEGYGVITVQLDQSAAPVTAANFVMLAKRGFYDGLTFHRIMYGYMMQGGCPEGTGYGGSDRTIVGEFAANGYNNPLSHKRGAISMARSQDYNSASSQFFIMHQDYTGWDGNYAAFGYVVEGMDIVDAVCAAARPIDGNGSIAKAQQPVMKSVTIRTEKAQ